ncbi:MAG: metal-binding protein [Oscillospiraceae bacterium]|nr:metal-binding protein [Oscillospiraceae bacterium]
MKNSFKFFENKECEYYPCHNTDRPLNCLFCYCPLYAKEVCPGTPQYLEINGRKIKDCSGCTFPHKRENYDLIMKYLTE